MHQLTFVLKRAHHATLKMLRPIAAQYDLTPARVDVLNILLVRDFGPTIMPYQAAIARALGLCRSTICKMVVALEKAGFVKRVLALWGDQRCRCVKLTPYGRRCLLRVLKAIRSRAVERPLFNALTRWTRTRDERTIFMHELDARAMRLSSGLGDRAQQGLYPSIGLPWRPSRDRPKSPLLTAVGAVGAVSPARRRALDLPGPP
jgi:DNA-binding MarR family transcriptional regulator